MKKNPLPPSKPKIPLQQHRKDIGTFKDEMKHYRLYADVLKRILQEAVNIHAKDGIVQARPKSMESFSEKIIRKDKYINPLEEMTDLCGARVIVHFESQVKAICDFIRNNFEIDEVNSVDVKTRLKMTEFGYRSVHYIVTPRSPRILGVRIPKAIQNKKAEIQVRTFNEHVWADILHDRIYKTKLRVPSAWQRESARLAAVLEEVDNSFKSISETLDQFVVNFRSTPDRKNLENEIFILKTLLRVNKKISDKTAEHCLKLSMVYNLQGHWNLIADLLRPLFNKLKSIKSLETRGRVKLEYGYALGKLNRVNPDDAAFKQGINLIMEALVLFDDNPRYHLEISKANYYLAALYEAKKEPETVAGFLLRAVRFAPDNPYYLLRSIIAELSLKKNIRDKDNDLFTPQLRKILETCREHIEMGIEVPEAYIAMGLSYFLLGDQNNSALQFIELLMLLQQRDLTVSVDTIQDAMMLTEKIKGSNNQIIMGLLQLITWKQFGTSAAKEYLTSLRSKNLQFGDNVLIIAGLSRQFNEHELKLYSTYIHEALFEYTGDVVSGGTSSGLPGLVGTEAGNAIISNAKGYKLYGYIPGNLPDFSGLNHDYDTLITSDSDHFSFAEVFQYWIDILMNETPVQNIMLLGINGGAISETEYKLALALGAKTALVVNTGGAADTTLNSQLWAKCSNLMAVPQDPHTVWALVMQYRKSSIDAHILQSAGQLVHKEYRKKRLKKFDPSTTDINRLKEVMEWQFLDPNLKVSNLKQLEFMEHLLRRVGLDIRQVPIPAEFRIPEDLISKKDFEFLARLEHARWNAERLLDGWKYGPVKDVNNKISDCLLPWDKLTAEIKTYDYDPVKNFPDLLGRMGYEIYRPRSAQAPA
jgi:ppGpp synthetase/RelA/SpoT-type nucleotidyltranferase